MAVFPDLKGDLAAIDNRLHTIVFENIEMPMSIGIFDQEKRKRQTVSISAEVLVARRTPVTDDTIENALDYNKIYSGIAALAGGPHIHLQESLAEAVAHLCLQFDEVVAAAVHVRKPEAYEDCDSVGVRIVRTREAAA
jgi:dihydroneopterin aldolase